MKQEIIVNFLKETNDEGERLLLDPQQVGSAIVSVDDPFVLHYRDRWWLFFTASTGQRSRIGWITSEDTRHWSEPSFGPEGHSPWILRHNDLDEPFPKMRRGLFWLVLSGSLRPEEPSVIRLFFSDDLVHWQTFSPPVILDPCDGDEWERKGLQTPCLLEKDGLFWLFYAGCDGSCAIGLAHSRDLVHWSRDAGNPLIQQAVPYRRPSFYRWEGKWWLLLDQPNGSVAIVSDELRDWKDLSSSHLIPDCHSCYLMIDQRTLSLFYSKGPATARSLYCRTLYLG
ncbi:MAG: hypothetical protein NZ959_02510 [Armatimonadetes bacterium]|nr:hypothetical protein [Armatimonadota bacterium]MDW8120955.1 hypothetical protein [Armatimonadota bacterium]